MGACFNGEADVGRNRVGSPHCRLLPPLVAYRGGYLWILLLEFVTRAVRFAWLMTKWLNSIESVIAEFAQGTAWRLLWTMKTRENEGDLIMAGEWATPAAVNFMARFGRGFDLRAHHIRAA